jgi:hypothetical protein
MVTPLLLSFRIEAVVSSAAHSSKPREYRFGGAGRQDTTPLPATWRPRLDASYTQGESSQRGTFETPGSLIMHTRSSLCGLPA